MRQRTVQLARLLPMSSVLLTLPCIAPDEARYRSA
jgi:hypothetical protein